METVNWPGAIEKNREALLRIVEALFALIGLDDRGAVATLPRRLRNSVLRILRPAESAVRRLIVMAAYACLPDGWGESDFDGLAGAKSGRRKSREKASFASSSFPLIEPLKRFRFSPSRRKPKGFPRISIIGLTEPRPIPAGWIPSPDDPLDATRLCARLRALKKALGDIEGQATRLARWKAKRKLGLSRSKRFSPLRPGWPPGYRKRPVHEVDDMLRECHSLAMYAQRIDSS